MKNGNARCSGVQRLRDSFSFRHTASLKVCARLASALAVAAAAIFALAAVREPVQAQSSEQPIIALQNQITGFTLPVGITHAGDASGRLFVVEQGGRIRIVKNGTLLATPFLDISSRISTGGERGLLGLAFPPSYARKGYFYVNYTDTAGNTVIARYLRSANPDAADPASEQVILNIPQPFANHNGGQLAFSPRDGFLYIGMGDGGSGGDPGNRAQNPAELLGKMLRIDTETGRPFTYTVPASNPFIGRAGTRPEIWASGLRNPWRFSFDRALGDLYIADVGQNNFEEINFQNVISNGGENYGWRIMEAAHCFNPSSGCTTTGLTLPVWEYDHSLGCSVTGGYVYRGATFGRMQGLYFYGDFCSGRIWALRRPLAPGGGWANTLHFDADFQISAFGEDENLNLWVASYNTGSIFQLVDTAQPPTPVPTPTLTTLRFSSPVFNTQEQTGTAVVAITRSGDISNPLSVDVTTSEGTASERSDYTTFVGTIDFGPAERMKTFTILITDDAIVEGSESLAVNMSNVVGNAIIEPGGAVVTINDNDSANGPNPIGDTQFFVRQHYRDFFSREPDAAGLQFWTNNIESCGADAQCREVKRIDTSAAFFLSIEFQGTGFYVYRLNRAAFGQLPRFRQFLEDTQTIGRGIVVGEGDWQAQLRAKRQAFAEEFVTRPEFVALYPNNQTPSQYVDALNANAGGALSVAERNALVARLISGDETRASALLKVAEDDDFERAEFNRAFVLMQYFGYLRRNPDDAPDGDFSGFNFWLQKLNEHGGDFRRAEMVKSFLRSGEYRQRFGQP